MPERFAAVLLAGGRSRRYGRANKLLAPLRGRPLIAAAIAAARRSQASPLIVVTGHQAGRLRRALAPWRRRLPLRLVHNRRYGSGMASSLRRGLAAVPAGHAGAIVMLADMPQLRGSDIDALIAAWRPGDAAVVPAARGRRGNPVLLGRALFATLQSLSGDRGARELLRRSEGVRLLETRGAFGDIDTPRDRLRLNRAATPAVGRPAPPRPRARGSC